MKMYCITIFDNHLEKINKIGYVPVGLGDKIVSKKFLTDKTKENISQKNSFYGEYTFHYWLWKNGDKELPENEWIGFCQYRKYWSLKKSNFANCENLEDLRETILKKIPENLIDYESILGEPLFINQFKLTKFLKNNFKTMIKNPKLFINKNKRNIKFHFDMMHGNGNLDKAIKLLEKDDRDDFDNFINSEVSFNPHNMFICRSSKTLKKYYNSLFPWLKRCEKEFGFDLKGYGLQRIYGFLAERFMSYWFRKNTKFTTLPIIFKDISELN
tara:strand:+ start:1578 stop:2390 length:813 start_codon:yes stop_codon:yes gene_type:complete